MCIERASRLVTVNLSGVMVQGDFGKQGPVRIITEGSTFWRCKTYHERIQANLEVYAGRILGRQWQFVQAVDANLVGAAAAGLSRVL